MQPSLTGSWGYPSACPAPPAGSLAGERTARHLPRSVL